MEISNRVVKTEHIEKIYKFSSKIENHSYEIIIENGKIKEATYLGPHCCHREYFSYDKNYDDLHFIIEGILFLGDISELKNIYDVLNNGPEKDFVKSIQKEILKKLNF